MSALNLRGWIYIGLLSLTVSAISDAAEILKGQVSLWKRPVCIEAKNCPLPQAFGTPWTVNLELKKPSIWGTSTSKSVTLKQETWTVLLTFYWIYPPAPEKDYVATQIRMTHSQFGLVLECSRYDFLESLNGFPVGACSGRMGSQQIGLTTKR
jgi:hypothetical protein